MDYRGYGASGGQPSFATMMRHTHTVLSAVRSGLVGEGFNGRLFIMGRSLGVHAAAKIAAFYPDQVAGLIVESGAAGVARMVAALTQMGQKGAAAELARRHEAKLRSIRIPVLMLHGDHDELIPLETALSFHEMLEPRNAARMALASTLETALSFHEMLEPPDKRLVIIPGAGPTISCWSGCDSTSRRCRSSSRRIAEGCSWTDPRRL